MDDAMVVDVDYYGLYYLECKEHRYVGYTYKDSYFPPSHFFSPALFISSSSSSVATWKHPSGH